MEHHYKALTETDIKSLALFLQPFAFIKFDIVLDAANGGTMMTLEELENNFGFYFDDEEKLVLHAILKNHGFTMQTTVRTKFVKNREGVK